MSHPRTSWSGVARVMRVFAAVASVGRLRLCCSCYGSYLPLDSVPPGFELGSATELDPVLAPSEEGDGFNGTLRTVEFAVYYLCGDNKTPEEHYFMCCAWVQRMLPLLHERGIAEVYAYK